MEYGPVVACYNMLNDPTKVAPNCEKYNPLLNSLAPGEKIFILKCNFQIYFHDWYQAHSHWKVWRYVLKMCIGNKI